MSLALIGGLLGKTSIPGTAIISSMISTIPNDVQQIDCLISRLQKYRNHLMSRERWEKRKAEIDEAFDQRDTDLRQAISNGFAAPPRVASAFLYDAVASQCADDDTHKRRTSVEVDILFADLLGEPVC